MKKVSILICLTTIAIVAILGAVAVLNNQIPTYNRLPSKAALGNLDLFVNKDNGESIPVSEFVDYLNSPLSDELIRTYSLQIYEAAEGNYNHFEQYLKKYPGRAVWQSNSSGIHFSLIVQGTSREVIEVVFGSELNRPNNLDASVLDKITADKIITNLDQDGYMQEIVYPNLGLSFVVFDVGGPQPIIKGFNLFNPINNDQYEKMYGLGWQSDLVRIYTFL